MKLSKNHLSPMGRGSIQRIYSKEARDEENFSKAPINHADGVLGKIIALFNAGHHIGFKGFFHSKIQVAG